MVIILLLCSPCSEGYNNNKRSPDNPDDVQFYACHDYTDLENRGIKTSSLGTTNYKVQKHGIDEPLQGVYSDLLDIYEIRNYEELFHGPICEKRYSFKDITSVETPTHILDHSDRLHETELLEVEEEYDKNAIKDPYYLYSNPSYIGSKITYSDKANELFIREHRSHDAENLTHRLDHRVNQ
jgi:hypothetical protein